MARTVRHANLGSRSARLRLPVGEHFMCLAPGRLHLGYVKRHPSKPGTWFARVHLHDAATGKNPYRKTKIGFADDFHDADGVDYFDFAVAQRQANAIADAPKVDARRPVTVADVHARYLEHLAAKGPRSESDARTRGRVHILPTLGSVRVADLTLEKLNRWKNALAVTPPIHKSVPGQPVVYRRFTGDADAMRARKCSANKVIASLKAALNLAREEGTIGDGPWQRFKQFPQKDTFRSRADFLSVEEARRLVAGADEASGFRDLVRAALESGCRYGELAALRVDDYARAQLRIRNSKNGEARYVQLTEDGAKFFARLASGRPADELLLSRSGGKPWKQANQQRPMAAACKAAGLRQINFHQLRHTWASLSIENDIPLLLIAKNLGHKDTKMVERHYGHLKDRFFEEQIRTRAPKYGFDGAENVVPLRRGEAG